MNFNISFRIEVVLLIFIIFLIMSGHVVCSCSKVGLLEGLSLLQDKFKKGKRGLPLGNPDASLVATNAAKYGREGFVSSNFQSGGIINEGQSVPYANTRNPIKTDWWFTPDLTSKNGKDKGKGIQAIANRPKQPIPLPEGELLLFANTQFSPKCCPNAYSTSKGCACMTTGQYDYLINRGGNNVPYSEY
jgi:hypothetical protein